MPEITTIKKTFTYDIADAYLYQTNKLKKKGEWTYIGPDKLWIFVDNETKLIISRFHYTERDNGAEVPTPEGQTKILVDATVDPLLASLIHDETDYTTIPMQRIPLPDGTVFELTDPIAPDHTYEISEIEYNFTTNQFKKPYPWKKPYMTWDNIKQVRNSLLDASDMQYKICPDEKKEAWELYRQKLRDLPVTFENIDPWMVRIPLSPNEE